MSLLDLKVTGGRVYHDGAVQELTLGITGERISHLLEPDVQIEAREELQLDGELVLPGFVDGHVHFREPGNIEKEGIESGSAAAAASGVTTVVEMPNTTPPTLTVDRLAKKIELFTAKSHVDFGLFGAITEENLYTGDIAALANQGVTAFKTFMATSFGPLLMADKGALYTAFEEVAETGRPLYIHAEDEEYLEEFTNRATNEYGDSIASFFESRPKIAETTAVQDVLDIVSRTQTKTVIAHTTTAESLGHISAARANDLPVFAEVTPYHLNFTRENIENVGTEGIGTPPVRDEQNRQQLWSHLRDNDVQLIGSDHAPHQLHEKDAAPLNVAPGMPQLETALPSLFDAVARGSVGIERIVELYAEFPARIHGLFPRKGALRVGSDADFVVVDTAAEWTVDAENFESSGAYSPFHGETLTGKPLFTYQRGNRISVDMETVNDPGDGNFLQPS